MTVKLQRRACLAPPIVTWLVACVLKLASKQLSKLFVYVRKVSTKYTCGEQCRVNPRKPLALPARARPPGRLPQQVRRARSPGRLLGCTAPGEARAEGPAPSPLDQGKVKY